MNAKPRVWAYAPCWYWFGWRTLNPIHLGGDEYGRRTLMLGWTITGRVIVALWQSYEPDEPIGNDGLTDADRVEYARRYAEGAGSKTLHPLEREFLLRRRAESIRRWDERYRAWSATEKTNGDRA